MVDMGKNVLIALGGTGGHIFPALAYADELQEKIPEAKISFIGGKLHTNDYFDRTQNAYYNVSCGKLVKNPITFACESAKILAGVYQSLKVLWTLKPSLLVGFGSYHSFPVLLAAKMAKIPIVLHESNSIPGRVVRLFSPFSQMTTIFFPDAETHLKGNIVSVKMPLRQKQKIAKSEARGYFQLEKEAFTILVFGGSQGAKAINEFFFLAAKQFLSTSLKNWQVIHLTGNENDFKRLSREYKNANIQAAVKPFETKMEMAWSSADMVVSRAGACTIAEQIEFEVPGIVIPYPFAMDKHQDANALFAKKYNMVIPLDEVDISSASLAKEVMQVREHAYTMKQNIINYKANNHVPSLADLTAALIKE